MGGKFCAGKCQSLVGLLFAFCSAVFFTSLGLIVQLTGIPAIEMVWWRCAGQLLFLVPVTTYRYFKGHDDAELFGLLNLKNIPERFGWLVLRGLVGTTAMWVIFEAYSLRSDTWYLKKSIFSH